MAYFLWSVTDGKYSLNQKLYISVTPAVRYIRKVVRRLEIAVVLKQVPTRKQCSFFNLQSMSQLVPVMFTFHTVCITASSQIVCVHECIHTYCFVRPTYTYGVSVTFFLRGNTVHNLDYEEPPTDALVRTLTSYDEVPVLDPNPETGYPDKHFVVPPVAARNVSMVRGISLQTLPSTSFPIHYPLIFVSLDTT